MKQFIVCSADAGYFSKYAIPLVKSAELSGINVHFDCLDFDLKGLETSLLKTIIDWSKNRKIDFTYSHTNFPTGLDPQLRKVLYSCGRINAIVELMNNDILVGENRAYMSLDIDSLVLRNFRFPVNNEKHVAFYFRDPAKHGARTEWETRGMKLLGSFFITTKMAPYLKRCKLRIDNTNKKPWFIDQVTLYETLLPQDLAASYDFSSDNILGWDMANPFNYSVLTAKGDRKNNERYVSLSNNYQTLFFDEVKSENPN